MPALRPLKMKGPWGKISAFLFGLFLCLVIISCLEGVFFVLNSLKNSRAPEIARIPRGTADFIQEDEILSYKLTPNNEISETSYNRSQEIYKAVYSTDEFGRRVTPYGNARERKKFMLFFGCSFTFGQGVNEDETLPFYLAQLAPHYRPYNYGAPGYGPQNMLAKIQEGEIEKEVQEAEGIVLYLFIEDHIVRAVGSMRSIAPLPYYFIDAKGGLAREGDCYSARPFIGYLYRQLRKSQVLDYFNIDFPPRFNSRHIELAGRIIEESDRLIKRKFRNSSLYVIIIPGGGRINKEMTDYLRNAGLNYLDYSADNALNSPEMFFLYDGHPKPAWYSLLAARIAGDIGSLRE